MVGHPSRPHPLTAASTELFRHLTRHGTIPRNDDNHEMIKLSAIKAIWTNVLFGCRSRKPKILMC